MGAAFEKALSVARGLYPHEINHYEEYEKYFVFSYEDGIERVGGELSPIVIRKEDMAALNYAPIFFNMGTDAEDVGDVVSEGRI